MCLALQLVLLGWFFLDMVGVRIGGRDLVTRSWRDDGVFFLIYAVAITVFVTRERVGKWLVATWLLLWFAVEFMVHEWHAIFGGGQGVARYFATTIHWTTGTTRYYPDVYHTVLHVLIVAAVVSTITFFVQTRRPI